MPYQVGDTVQLALDVVSGGSNVYAYVWRLWDGSIETTADGTLSKRINIGGDPTNGNKLIYACTPALLDGRSVTSYGTIVANNPPYLAASPTASTNDDYYGYATTLSVKVYTIDGHGPVTTSWRDGATSLGAGINGATSSVSHTWQGNDKVVSGSYTAQENHLTVSVNADRVITFSGTDTAGGVTQIDFRLRGLPVPELDGVLTVDGNSVTTDATSQPVQRIGPGQTITFIAYVKDIDGLAPSFAWELDASNGWSVPSTGPGSTSTLPDGTFANSYVKSVSGESTGAAAAKTVLAICRVAANAASRAHGKTARLEFYAELLKNNPPSGTTVVCTKASDGSVVNMSSATISAGTKLIYAANSSDPDLDAVEHAWQVNGATTYSYGPKIVVDTTGMSGAVSLRVTATDRMGAALVSFFSGPTIS